MQDLHGDPSTRIMHPVSHMAMIGDVLGGIKPGGPRKNAAFTVRRHAGSDHEADTARPAGRCPPPGETSATRFRSFVSSSPVGIGPIRTRFPSVTWRRSGGARR